MARKKLNDETLKELKNAPITNQPITEMLEINYMPYAMSVIVSRAIPEIDGFKPSHRKLLYTMYKMGLLKGDRTKSANVVGQTMKLNPHGDSAIYETMVRLTTGNSSLLHPYVDSKGNFGKVYSDMAFAASRYTEVKLDKICAELFEGLDKNAVDMVDNYDGSIKEPKLLPATFPSVLVNNNQGIAVGMASNICSFNLREVCDATIAYMKDPDVDLLEIMPAPDFPGGGQILFDKNAMKEIYETGRGPVRIRAKYRVEKNVITVYEIPYTQNAEALCEEIIDLVTKNKVREIKNVQDATDLNGLAIKIECKTGTDCDDLMTKLFKLTKLEDVFSCNFNILIDGTPKVLGVKDIIREWLDWRRGCLLRELQYDYDKKNEALHLLEGLAAILLDIDKAIKIIRETELEEEVVPNLMEGFKIDKIQAEYVADIKLRNINKQYILRRLEDKQKLIDDINELADIMSKPKRMDTLIINTLKEVAKKYGKDRKSEVAMQDEVTHYSAAEVIPDYRLRLMLTRHGYLKKHSLASLRSAGELKTKEDDEIFIDVEVDNKSDILIFTDHSNVYKAKTYEFQDTKPSELGYFLQQELMMEEGEKVLYMVVTTDYKGKILIAFQNGKAAIFPISAYETKQNRKKLLNGFFGGSPAVSFIFMNDDENMDVAVFNDLQKAAVFNTSLIPFKTTRTTQGVQVMISKRGSQLVSLKPLTEEMFTDCEYYRVRKIPAIGYYIRENSIESKQIGMEGI